MQFYIPHTDPTTAARALPTYALRVNLKEGWQILSDLAHRFGVTWDGQNKPYNPAHPWTRTFSHKAGFNRLIHHLRANAAEYYNRTGKQTVWQDLIADFVGNDLDETLFNALPKDQEAETLDYLTRAKRDKYGAEEYNALRRLLPLIVLALAFFAFPAKATTPAEIEQLIPALIQVESGGRDYAIGDGGLAAGPLQIHPIMVRDVNRIAGTHYTLADRLDRRKSIEIARIYFQHYGRHWTIERAARAWNSGPTSTRGTDGYWRKVKKELDRLEK